jgi:hypothetical protein
MNLSEQATSLLAFGTTFAVPMLFMVSVRPFFEWGRAARLFWIALVAGGFVLSVVLFRMGELPDRWITPWLPAVQLSWYHLLWRAMYGGWNARPALVMFVFRPASGSQRDRVFGVLFVLSSLAMPIFA